MVLNFGKLGGGNVVDEAHDPRTIFSALTKDQKYSYPRDVQAQVWEDWFKRRDEKDLVVKMNTGSGKTVVGLLILKSCLNESKGPAVFFTPDKYLSEQVIKEAHSLGIPVTTDEKSAEFISGKSILVTNVHKLFNGKSVFGVGDEGIKIKIGAMLIDDAHACLTTIKERFTIRLSSSHPAYARLWPILRPGLIEQSQSKVMEIEAHDPVAQMRVPFWTWQKEQETIIKILHDYRDDNEVKFVWPLVKENLNLCQCNLGSGFLEISASYLPIDIVPSFRAANRRIFMSATISDETIFVSDLKADEKSIQNVIAPKTADDLGDRMILFPQKSNPRISDEDLRSFVKHIASSLNVVVLVPSRKRADFWSSVANATLDQESIVSGVEKLKTGLLGLTVLVNRYDGIDLPGNAARLLVLDGIPQAQSIREKMDNNLLRMSDEYLQKQVSKIEQGIGRGTRSNDDFCVVLLMGSSLTHFLYSPEAKQKFSKATLAQIELGERVSDQIKGKTLNEMLEVMNLCFTRNHEWVKVAKSTISGLVSSKTAKFTQWQLALGKAYHLSSIGQHQQAVNLLQQQINLTKDESLKGYLFQCAAEIMNFYDQNSSQQLLLSGIQFNRGILRPIKGINYSKINAPDNGQAESAVAFYKERFLEPNDCILEINRLIDDLKFEDDFASEFESAVSFLGKFIGYSSQRPDNDIGTGPDVLWAVGELKYFIIECKNGIKIGNNVSKSHVEQLQSSLTWFESTYDKSCTTTQIMVHPSRDLENTAFATNSMKVIDVEKLEDLKNSLKNYTADLCHDGSLYKVEKVKQKIQQYGFDRTQFISRYTKDFRKI